MDDTSAEWANAPGPLAPLPIVSADQGNVAAIYDSLARHQVTSQWESRDLMAWLHLWRDRFNARFKLDVAEVALFVERLSANRYGHFHEGFNGFGLRGEVAINKRYLDRPPGNILGTLLHELLHAWQQEHGSPAQGNHHNREFRSKARSLGLEIDERGVTVYLPEGPFQDLLAEFGVPPVENAAVRHHDKGTSKLRKWSCGCQSARVGTREFFAVCTRCNRPFEPAG